MTEEERDFRDLWQLHARSVGWSATEIAEEWQDTRSAALGRINRIRRHDTAHSGEPLAAVLPHYQSKRG